ncbi:hypothetical protein L596_005592 [Steinernema carpocapsae]|uniref:MD-2-related lipid-recognition domain-containing protein n=1 Tax=Steinernema carpocapsae TaxID=34508 RepID=A0A4U8V0Q5_STECR|nr:hypothetical protein L596_005592 [Steinernema carpocapsae]
MIFRVVTAAAVLLFAFVCCTEAKSVPVHFNSCGYPNKTNIAPNTYTCDPAAAIQIKKTSILDQKSMKPIYPIDPAHPIIIQLTAVNHGVAYTDNKANVKLYSYSSDWMTGECKWSEIHTFGLLNNIDGCKMAHNCPLKPGNLVLKLPLDLSKYATIIDLLASGTAYELRIEMHDYNQGSSHEVISCVVAQVKFV